MPIFGISNLEWQVSHETKKNWIYNSFNSTISCLVLSQITQNLKLLAKLVAQVRSRLSINIDDYYFWSDSSIVLAWLSKPPSQLKTFAANRVTDIVSTTDVSQWHHKRLTMIQQI